MECFCIWCGDPICKGEKTCPSCLKACKRSCISCKKPYPSLKYFLKSEIRCNSCTTRYMKCREKRKKCSLLNVKSARTSQLKHKPKTCRTPTAQMIPIASPSLKKLKKIRRLPNPKRSQQKQILQFLRSPTTTTTTNKTSKVNQNQI